MKHSNGMATYYGYGHPYAQATARPLIWDYNWLGTLTMEQRKNELLHAVSEAGVKAIDLVYAEELFALEENKISIAMDILVKKASVGHRLRRSPMFLLNK
ncbi:hypothetical protein CONPUDRAFT_151295 [Coniophora puteana RWD-64-598 SS2]|uniref:Uncharacterized protein n=1 Tax=Coniophora puteana (strain RWD-64-598) TaxID=741705 RepID=A0A5M3MYP5_CONPW|nr:uncharacterized protein CONPUDRAFT_151295 [Coniophora puteana RWD-64-598 SS2]EIW84262.1 hypothetical protein CONPUDRAFT_151295 [Coniophora puteana RWD-64-598 SS2]